MKFQTLPLLTHHTYKLHEAGVDEAGRGCYAGPVCAAAVILPKGYSNNLLNDSKKLTTKQRNHLQSEIEKIALCYAVAMVSVQVIDTINILQASVQAMHQAIAQLTTTPKLLLIDGNYFKPTQNLVPYHTIIKGDSKYQSIAAASILAKTHRDKYMLALHLQQPLYGWASNKGYGTALHRAAIAQYGYTQHHRRSFNI